MEVESTMTTETEGAVKSEVGLVQTAASNDADQGLSQEPVTESDALIAVSTDAAVTTAVNYSCMAVEFDSLAATLSSAGDAGAAESPSPPVCDVSPSTPAATTSDCSLQQGASFDSSTQWSSSASVDTVQSVRHASSVPHPASSVLPEDDQPATATTTEEQRIDSEPYTAAEHIVELPPSSDSQQQQQQQQPEQLPKEEDVQVQDFKAGITCTDVPSAIDVLNTRYRLADVTIHRNMMTWSSWNIADIVRGPHRDSFWWRGRRTQQVPMQQQNGSRENIEYPDEDEHLAQKDVEELCSKIERREREIALMLERMDGDAADVITPETAQHQQQTYQPQSASSPASDKRRNVFQRLLHALRKRFARRRQQQQQQPPTTTATDQQRQRHQAIERRERTL